MCASRPSTGQSAGDSIRLFSPPREPADRFLVLLASDAFEDEYDWHRCLLVLVDERRIRS
jgi:hypothetical protein